MEIAGRHQFTVLPSAAQQNIPIRVRVTFRTHFLQSSAQGKDRETFAIYLIHNYLRIMTVLSFFCFEASPPVIYKHPYYSLPCSTHSHHRNEWQEKSTVHQFLLYSSSHPVVTIGLPVTSRSQSEQNKPSNKNQHQHKVMIDLETRRRAEQLDPLAH